MSENTKQQRRNLALENNEKRHMWTKEDKAFLLKYRHRPYKALATQLNRGYGAVQCMVTKMRRNGLIPQIRWTAQEDAIIKAHVAKKVRGIGNLLELLPNRTIDSVRYRVSRTKTGHRP